VSETRLRPLKICIAEYKRKKTYFRGTFRSPQWRPLIALISL